MRLSYNKQIAILVIISFLFIIVIPSITIFAKGEEYRQTIVLDAGHGGYDGGVKGITSNVKESTINLALVRLLKGYLESDGYKVILTRDSDMALGNTKQEDMKKRVEIINSSKCILMVSIHVNFYPSKYRRGIQSFFNKGIDEKFATIMQENLNITLNYPTLNRNFSALFGDYYILANSKCPATIVETGFISNPEDEKLLLDEGYRMKLSYQIFLGIKKYIQTTLVDKQSFSTMKCAITYLA